MFQLFRKFDLKCAMLLPWVERLLGISCNLYRFYADLVSNHSMVWSMKIASFSTAIGTALVRNSPKYDQDIIDLVGMLAIHILFGAGGFSSRQSVGSKKLVQQRRFFHTHSVFQLHMSINYRSIVADSWPVRLFQSHCHLLRERVGAQLIFARPSTHKVGEYALMIERLCRILWSSTGQQSLAA